MAIDTFGEFVTNPLVRALLRDLDGTIFTPSTLSFPYLLRQWAPMETSWRRMLWEQPELDSFGRVTSTFKYLDNRYPNDWDMFVIECSEARMGDILKEIHLKIHTEMVGWWADVSLKGGISSSWNDWDMEDTEQL